MDGTRVLVVGDAGGEVADAIAQPSAADVETAVVGSVDEARSLLSSGQVGCVVGGAALTSGDRLALLAAVRERDPSLPVAFVAADAPALPDAETTAVVDPDAPARLRETVRELVVECRDDERHRGRDRFRTLFEQIPDPVVMARREGGEPTVQAVNPAFEETFGFDAEAIRGESLDRYVVPADVDDEAVVELSTAEVGEVVEREVRRRTATGDREFLFRGLRTRVGGEIEHFGIYTDITERERRARRLDALHETTRGLLAADGIESVVEAAVEAAREVLELPAVGVHLADEGADRLTPAAFSAEVEALFDGAPPAYSPGDEVWSVYASGDDLVVPDVRDAEIDTAASRSAMVLPLGEHGVLISSSPAPNDFDDGTVELARLLAANTEAALDRAANEQALRERERTLRAERDRLAALFENAPVPVADVEFVDETPVVRDINASFEETFGYDAETLVGADLDAYLVPETRQDRADEYNERAAARNEIGTEVQRETADGLRDFLLTVAPVDPDADDGRVFAFYIDITDRRQRQQRLRVLSRVLRHDIRNRMNIIEGSAGIVAERVDDEEIARSARRIRRAAADLLAVSHKTRAIEGAVATDRHDAVDLIDEIRSAVADVRDRYPDCAIEVAAPERLAVRGSDAVGVAIDEVVENAVQHNDAAEPFVGIDVRTEGQYAVVEVADDGPGIPETDRAVVEGAREPTQLEHASGLGLWTVKWIVTGVGGELSFDVDEDGTVVRLRLPLAGEASESNGS